MPPTPHELLILYLRHYLMRQDRIDDARARKAARYEPRINPADQRWGVYDKTASEFCIGESCDRYPFAVAAAARLNAAYERAMAP